MAMNLDRLASNSQVLDLRVFTTLHVLCWLSNLSLKLPKQAFHQPSYLPSPLLELLFVCLVGFGAGFCMSFWLALNFKQPP